MQIQAKPTKLSNAIYAALHIPVPRGYFARGPGGELFTIYIGS